MIKTTTLTFTKPVNNSFFRNADETVCLCRDGLFRLFPNISASFFDYSKIKVVVSSKRQHRKGEQKVKFYRWASKLTTKTEATTLMDGAVNALVAMGGYDYKEFYMTITLYMTITQIA